MLRIRMFRGVLHLTEGKLTIFIIIITFVSFYGKPFMVFHEEAALFSTEIHLLLTPCKSLHLK